MNTQTPATTQQHATPARAERLANRPRLPAPVDILEGRDDFLIVADFPGVQPDDVDVRFDRNELALAGVARRKNAEWEWTRTFVVPGSVDATRISAELKDGVLSVRLPKKESVKPRQVTVRAA